MHKSNSIALFAATALCGVMAIALDLSAGAKLKTGAIQKVDVSPAISSGGSSRDRAVLVVRNSGAGWYATTVPGLVRVDVIVKAQLKTSILAVKARIDGSRGPWHTLYTVGQRKEGSQAGNKLEIRGGEINAEAAALGAAQHAALAWCQTNGPRSAGRTMTTQTLRLRIQVSHHRNARAKTEVVRDIGYVLVCERTAGKSRSETPAVP